MDSGPIAVMTSRNNNPHYVLVLLFMAYTFSFLDRQILSILFEPIKLEMGLSDTELGFLGGLAFALFYATLGIPIAMWADRGVRTRIITGSLIIFSGMTALCGLAQNFWQLALARVGVGVGEAGVNPSAHSIIADLYPPEKRSTAMGVLAMGANVGILIGLAVGGFLSVAYGWRVAIMAVGFPGLLLGLLFWATVREPARGASESRASAEPAPPLRQSLPYMWQNKAMRHIVLGSMLKGVGSYGISVWLPSFFMRTHDLTAAQTGVILALGIGVLGGAGTLFGGYLNDRLSRQRAGRGLATLALITALVYPLAAAAWLVDALPLAIGLYLLPMLTGGMFLAPGFALVQSLARLRMRSIASAVKMLAVNLIGLGIGPQAIGFLSDLLSPSLGTDSLRVAMCIVAAASVWGALHFYLASRHLEDGLRQAQS